MGRADIGDRHALAVVIHQKVRPRDDLFGEGDVSREPTRTERVIDGVERGLMCVVSGTRLSCSRTHCRQHGDTRVICLASGDLPGTQRLQGSAVNVDHPPADEECARVSQIFDNTVEFRCLQLYEAASARIDRSFLPHVDCVLDRYLHGLHSSKSPKYLATIPVSAPAHRKRCGTDTATEPAIIATAKPTAAIS
jgi:hypothetical protein